LHAPDQPLEPFLLSSANELIVPENLQSSPQNAKSRLIATARVRNAEAPQRYSLRLEWQPIEQALKAQRVFYTLVIRTPARVHGLIHHMPRHLKDLQNVLSDEGIDLVHWLREQLRELYLTLPSPRDEDFLLLILEVPQQRQAGEPIERVERWAFVLEDGIIKVSLVVGARAKAPDGGHAAILDFGTSPHVSDAELIGLSCVPLRMIAELTRADANLLSGIQPNESARKCTLVGAGAVGSQVYLALARTGWGTWTLIDDDVFLPHNTVRHALGDVAVGSYKVEALKQLADAFLPYNEVLKVMPANALGYGHDEDLIAAFREADTIVDTSASLAVARALALDIDTQARIVSAFLTPTGKDSVLIMESVDRRYRLDVLESQYYRAILRDDRLADHLRGHTGKIRYGGSCRDVTGVIAEDDVLLHSGILAKQMRRGLQQPDAKVTIWRQSTNGGVEQVAIQPRVGITEMIGDWRVTYDEGMLERCCEFRNYKLPRETGGVLVGYFDALRKTIYLVDALPAPPDSLEHATAFIRGVTGLRESLATIGDNTAGIVQYVGEWHSHPVHFSIEMSPLDRRLLQEIADQMRFDGWPGLIMIVGDSGRCAVYLETSAIE
jgi:hypothetical protein